MLTIFIITFVVIAGTAAASFWSTTTTKTIQFGSSPALSTTTTTTALSNSKAENTGITVVRTSSDDNLVSALLRILGLQVDVDEITTFRGRNMGYGEITLAYNLAHASGKSVHQILDMRYEEKMGWGKIANTLGVKLHDKADNAQLILRDAQLMMMRTNLRLISRLILMTKTKKTSTLTILRTIHTNLNIMMIIRTRIKTRENPMAKNQTKILRYLTGLSA